MPRPPKQLTPAPPITEVDFSNEKLSIELESLEERMTEKLDDDFIKVLKRVAYYTAKVGLPLKEACNLAGIPFEKLQVYMEREPLIAEMIALKELEYKRDLLRVISNQAFNGDDKLAQWLLERKYPEEYGAKKGGGGMGGDKDLMYEAIEFIQKHGDSSPLVSGDSGKSVVIKKGIIREIKDILS